MSQIAEQESKIKGGPKFQVDVEGTLHDWDRDTIATDDIAALGGWDSSVGIIVIDKDNNERTLVAGQTIELKPGQGFAKKIKFKRG